MDPKLLPKMCSARSLFVPRRRQQKKLRDNIMGITRPAIRRIARRGGIVRIKKDVYNEVRIAVRDRLHEILKQVVLVVESSGSKRNPRKVVNTKDVVWALNRMGYTLYGFGHM